MKPALARTAIHALLSRLRAGELTVVEGGRARAFGPGGAPSALVEVRSDELWPRLLRGSRGLAESYMAGLWETPDLPAVVRVAARNIVAIDALRLRLTPLREPYQRARALLVRNTPRRSRDDIAAHYDLGNDLFEQMLDPTMMYSCAVFPHAAATLEQAQRTKLDLICRKLQLGPGDRLLEIGTGWGALAIHAAQRWGCRVTTTTLSREQRDLAVRRIADAGLSDRVEVVMEDYRSLHGTYDKLVSIEMIEAVGWKDFGTFFRACSDRLTPQGLMLLQAIVIDDRAYAVEKASKTFIRSYIFPNGCLPSNAVIARSLARETDLRTVHLEDLSAHYARTLAQWRANLEAGGDTLAAGGYDERFQRLWRLYLAYCEAGFAERRIGLVQQVMAKPDWRGTITTSAAAVAQPGAIAVS